MMGPSEKLHQGQFRKKVLGMKNGFLHLHSTCLFVFRLNGKSCFCFLLIEVLFSFDDGRINHLKFVFEQSKTRHLSAEDVYKQMLLEDLDVGLATVYRVLTQFEQAGILRRSNFEAGKAVFELDQGSHHDHLVCIDCGRVEEFFDPRIEERQRKIAEAHGFELQDHALALYGQCQRKACPHRRGKAA